MAKDTRPKHVHNAPPSALPPDAPVDAAKVEFARRLQQAMVRKGWTQADLARSSGIGRDSISLYMRGMSFPGASRLADLARALNVTPEELKPAAGVKSADNPSVEVRETADGKVWLRVNQQVDWPTATKVLNILKGE